MERRFRQFVIMSAALAVAVELIMWFYVPEDSIALDLWTLDGYGSMIAPSLLIYVLYLTAKFLILFGLYAFSSSARTAFLLYLVFVVLSSIAWGWRVTPPIVGPFGALVWIVDGVILSLIYYGPIAKRFAKAEQ